MRRKTVLVLGGLLLGSVVIFWGRQGCSPEGRLAAQLEELTVVMDEHMDAPRVGVQELFDTLQEELPEMLEQTGKLMTTLDSIEDDAQRDERAQEMVAALKTPVQEYLRTSERFFSRVERDPAAREALKKRLRRLERLGDIFEGLKKLVSLR
jgi:DNA repair ATPase RecN